MFGVDFGTCLTEPDALDNIFVGFVEVALTEQVVVVGVDLFQCVFDFLFDRFFFGCGQFFEFACFITGFIVLFQFFDRRLYLLFGNTCRSFVGRTGFFARTHSDKGSDKSFYVKTFLFVEIDRQASA